MYLYDNMDTTTKFNETELPPKEEFYSKLNDSDISHEDYKNVKKVWKEFKMKTMGDYHDLYLKTDVLLRANMFEESRNGCHKLDPAWYFPAPGLAWDATLKETAVELESLTDPAAADDWKRKSGRNLYDLKWFCAGKQEILG